MGRLDLRHVFDFSLKYKCSNLIFLILVNFRTSDILLELKMLPRFDFSLYFKGLLREFSIFEPKFAIFEEKTRKNIFRINSGIFLCILIAPQFTLRMIFNLKIFGIQPTLVQKSAKISRFSKKIRHQMTYRANY